MVIQERYTCQAHLFSDDLPPVGYKNPRVSRYTFVRGKNRNAPTSSQPKWAAYKNLRADRYTCFVKEQEAAPSPPNRWLTKVEAPVAPSPPNRWPTEVEALAAP